MTRLPNPGSDDGEWGDILNEYLQVAHDSEGALKSEAVGASVLQDGSVNADKLDISGGSNGQFLAKNTGASGGFEWASSHTDRSSIYPLSAYGFFTATDSLSQFTTTSSIGGAFFARIFVPAGEAINAIGTLVASAGTAGGGGLNSFAIYADDGTLVASTPDDDSIWLSTGWQIQSLVSPIAAQANDRFVYASLAAHGYTDAPSIFYMNTISQLIAGGGYGVTNNRRAFVNSIGSWPATINPSTYGSDVGGYLPFIALG